MCCLQITCFEYKDTHRLKVTGWRKIYHTNTNQKKGGIAVLLSDKVDFRTRKIFRGKKGNT